MQWCVSGRILQPLYLRNMRLCFDREINSSASDTIFKINNRFGKWRIVISLNGSLSRKYYYKTDIVASKRQRTLYTASPTCAAATNK